MCTPRLHRENFGKTSKRKNFISIFKKQSSKYRRKQLVPFSDVDPPFATYRSSQGRHTFIDSTRLEERGEKKGKEEERVWHTILKIRASVNGLGCRFLEGTRFRLLWAVHAFSALGRAVDRLCHRSFLRKLSLVSKRRRQRRLLRQAAEFKNPAPRRR